MDKLRIVRAPAQTDTGTARAKPIPIVRPKPPSAAKRRPAYATEIPFDKIEGVLIDYFTARGFAPEFDEAYGSWWVDIGDQPFDMTEMMREIMEELFPDDAGA